MVSLTDLYELQTSIKDLDIQGGGTMRIPYRDYRTYLMRVLFPEPNNYDRQTALLLSTPPMGNFYGMLRDVYQTSNCNNINVVTLNSEFVRSIVSE